MTRSLPRRIVPFLLAVLLLASHAPAALAAPETLPDSTRVEQWTLANGLRVTTRHIPRATVAVVALGFGSGSAADPTGNEGLAWLLAETWFTAAAGEVPERSRAELESLRPLGWRVNVQARTTVFVEVASARQFPGVLHQAAQRLRGVRPTPPVIATALTSVREDLRGLFATRPDSMAWELPRALAAGADTAALRRSATGAALAALSPRELEQRIRARFAPSNAALSLAGDFKGIDLRAFVEREFGGIPAGAPQPPVTFALRAVSSTIPVPGLGTRAGVAGVIAPALTDLDHAEFMLCTLFMGARARNVWGDAMPPLSSRFRFSMFDDPDLVRFFPPMDPDEGDTLWVSGRLEEVLDPMARTVLPPDLIDGYKRGVFWLLGGAMMPDMAARARTDPAVLSNLSISMATRALWQPESFWAEYRSRFGRIQTLPIETWVLYALDPRHQVRLVLRETERPR